MIYNLRAHSNLSQVCHVVTILGRGMYKQSHSLQGTYMAMKKSVHNRKRLLATDSLTLRLLKYIFALDVAVLATIKSLIRST